MSLWFYSEEKVLLVDSCACGASVASTSAAITSAVEKLGYSGLGNKFRSQRGFCSTASHNPLLWSLFL